MVKDTVENAEKECELCGKLFTPMRSNRKYCDECSPNSDRLKIQYGREMARSRKEYYEPTPITLKCDECGKDFVTIKKFIISKPVDPSKPNGEHYIFCSKACKQIFTVKHATCDFCGKSLEGTTYYNPAVPTSKFCNEECKAKWNRQLAEKRGWIKHCSWCGKEFIRATGTFCSQNCSREAQKNGWDSGSKKEPELRYITKIEVCSCCGKRVEKEYLTLPPVTDNWYCSEECKERHKELHVKRAMQASLEDVIRAKYKKKYPNNDKKAQKPVPCEKQLCESCKTPYKECERMQSSFRILPEGAHYNNKGILTVCPKYRG